MSLAIDYCRPAPDHILAMAGPSSENSDKPTPDIKTLLEAALPVGDKKEVTAEMKKTLVLATQKSKAHKNKPKRLSKRCLTSKEKRKLGLHRLPRRGLRYSDYEQLHLLWLGYMQELLELDTLEQAGWSPNLNEETRQLQLQVKVCRADLHGGRVRVASADCPGHVGLQGIVLLETKNTLQILGRDNRLRYIPKQGSSFSFKVGDYLFTVPGTSIDSKPGDRATKKLKNKFPCNF